MRYAANSWNARELQAAGTCLTALYRDARHVFANKAFHTALMVQRFGTCKSGKLKLWLMRLHTCAVIQIGAGEASA